MSRLLRFVALCCFLVPAAAAAAPDDPPDGVARLLTRLEEALQSGAPARYLPLLSPSADRRSAASFVGDMFRQGVRRVVVRERDRVPMDGVLPGDGFVITAEVLLEADRLARLSTCRFEIRRPSSLSAAAAQGQGEDDWRILDQRLLSELPLLHRLVLDTSTQLAGRDLVVTAQDLRLSFPDAVVFLARVGSGATAAVILGRGELRFAPGPAAERGQLRIFGGADILQTPIEAVVLRVPPQQFGDHVTGTLTPQPVVPGVARKAQEIFTQEATRSYVLDLGDLSKEPWSLLPADGDFIGEIRTHRFGTLTYARSAGDLEDISLFDRATRRNIAVYASPERLARGGRFFSEDEDADYRVVSYDIDASFQPAERWIEGRARLTVQVKAPAIRSLTLRLADSLGVASALSDELGRLLTVRVRGQNSVVVNLPTVMTKDATFSLTLAYSGLVSPQAVDQEALGDLGQSVPRDVVDEVPLTESYLYSNRSYWYPQAPTMDYATATLRLRVPTNFGCVASGRLVETSQAQDRKAGAARRFTFVAAQPVRYLACLITPLVHAASAVLHLGRSGAASGAAAPDGLSLAVKTNPRLQRTGTSLAATTEDVLRFYAGVMRDSPYPDETVAAIERPLPGGHSPAYMAVLSQPLPGTHVTWRNDPASFDRFPEFFVAHELAHQWWGQAVGWKNYHEQWLSEGLAQYFAALYAEQAHGPEVFGSIVRRFRDTSLEKSGQGPIYLGYRIGHIKRDMRAFRSIVYNKAALVLHMLRRTVGDEAFFTGLRRFYATWRFRKAGSDDLQRAMEAASGRSLERFFEKWVYEDAVPVISFDSRFEQGAAGQEAVVRLQQDVEPMDVPVTVSVTYEDGSRSDVLVQVSERVTECRIPLAASVKKIEVNRDGAALGVFRTGQQ